MATTTFETFRDAQAVLIEALTPTSHVDTPFRQHRDEQDLRDWAETQPRACFRRFSISDTFEYERPEIANNDLAWEDGIEEIVIAYPRDYRYGQGNARDRRDVIREDRQKLDYTVGMYATGYTNGRAVLLSFDEQEGDNAVFLVLTLRFYFWRSPST